MIDDYTIRHAFPLVAGTNEIEIESENLIYSEINLFHGMQCKSRKNYDRIFKLCAQVADLIKEIDKLNKEN